MYRAKDNMNFHSLPLSDYMYALASTLPLPARAGTYQIDQQAPTHQYNSGRAGTDPAASANSPVPFR